MYGDEDAGAVRRSSFVVHCCFASGTINGLSHKTMEPRPETVRPQKDCLSYVDDKGRGDRRRLDRVPGKRDDKDSCGS